MTITYRKNFLHILTIFLTLAGMVGAHSHPAAAQNAGVSEFLGPGDLFSLDLLLDGVNDYASTPDQVNLDLGTGIDSDFTLESFFYVPDLTNTTTDTLFWKNGAFGLYILFYTSQADRFIFRLNTDPSNYVFIYYNLDLSAGWHHAAAVFDNEYSPSQDLMALYVDGILATSSTAVEWSPGIPNSSSALNIGAYAGINPLNGWMEEARISDNVRYSGPTYSVPSAAFTPDESTKALWHFDDGWDAVTFSDSSSYGSSLIGQNGAKVGNPPGTPPNGPLCFVDDSASGSNNGTTWANAYNDLQSALADTDCTEIWVAAGTYKPTSGADRTVSFVLNNGAALYGGFAGTETQLDQRDWEANETILSGDLNGDDSGFINNGENSHHVVVGVFMDESTILDGFRIRGGNNDLAGGGIYLEAGSPTLRNLILSENFSNQGGGMYTDGSNPSLTNVTFNNNHANDGGGISLWDGSCPTLTKVYFIENTAVSGGGIFSLQTSSPTLTDVTFQYNTAETGGAIYQQAGSFTFSGVIFDGNTASWGGAMELRNLDDATINNSVFSGNAATRSGGALNVTNSNLEVRDTVFAGNTAVSGGGINNNGGNLTILRVSFNNNQATWGGGIYNESSNPSLTDVTFHSNSGGGMYNENSSPTLINVTFDRNTGGGMRNNGGSPKLTNVTLTGNDAYQGSGMYNDNSNPILNHVTFSSNTGSEAGGAMYNVNSSPVIANSIFWENAAWGDGSEIWGDSNSTPTIEDSIVQGGCPSGSTCTNIITEDPLLGPLQDNGGYTPTRAPGMGSSAIDAGGVHSACAETDQRGVIRPQGPACDIGSFEYDREYNSILYVRPGGLTSGLCDSWASACELQYAITQSVAGHEIWVAAGIYTPSDGTERTTSFALKNSVRIYGGFNGTETQRSQRDPVVHETILSGDLNGDDDGFINNGENSLHVVRGNSGTNGTAVLDGFTIRGGNANGAEPDSMGGGIFNNSSSPTLANLILRNNSAADGGGMFNHNSSPTLTNVIFESNTAAGSGGALLNISASSPVLSDVTFNSNSAGISGGGMFNSEGSPSLTNVTFSGNTANHGGGMENSGSNPNLTNVIFSNNDAVSGGGMYNSYCAPILNNVIFDKNTANSGGGMYNSTSSPTLNNVTFSENDTQGGGGGMLNTSGSNPDLTNVTFSGNTANYGGGMSNMDSSPKLTNVSLSSNSGGIRNLGNSDPELVNVILWENGTEIANDSGSGSNPTIQDSVVQGGCPSGSTCTHVISDNPHLGIPGNYGGFTQTLSLLPGSSAIDSGNDDVCPLTDQRGLNRPQDGDLDLFAVCDIGAFEYEPLPTVDSIIRSGTSPTTAASVDFIVTFSEDVTGVDANGSDFTLVLSAGITGAAITGVTPISDSVYTVSVNTGTGSGTLRLDVPNTATIENLDGKGLYGLPFESGDSYIKTASLTVRSNGTYDGWMLESSETSNKGGSMDSSATTLILGDDARDRQYRTILHFDTTSLPDNAVITSAVLKLRQQGISGTNPFMILNALRADMRKPDFGAPSLQLTDFAATAARNNTAVFSMTPVNQWYSGTLSNAGTTYINRNGTTQFKLYFTTGDNDDLGADIIKFFSGNAPAASRPRLVITYYVP